MIRLLCGGLFRLMLIAAAFSVPASARARAGQTSLKMGAVPKTVEQLKSLMGNDYAYLDRDGLLIVSDLEKKTLYQLVSRDFLINMNILKRDFFTRGRSGKGDSQTLLTIFLFNNRESYVQGLRRMGMDIAPGDESDQDAVRNGYFYGGRERNFILINFRENYEQGLATYSHEVAHALMRREFPDPPSWINEGFATMTGNSAVVNSHLRYSRNSSVKRTKKALDAGELPRVRDILKFTGEDYARREKSLRFYDAGEQFCRFLHSRNQLVPIYQALRDTGKKRGGSEEAVSRITGLTPDNLEKAWHDWLRRQ